MSVGTLGVDSSSPATGDAGGESLFALAHGVLGRAPAFWGRYFNIPGSTDPVQFQHKEIDFFHERSLKLLPFARQTTHVTGGKQQGARDALANAEAFVQMFGVDALKKQGGKGTHGATGSEFLIFLDVEPNHPLSVEYYAGWSMMLVTHSRSITNDQVTLLPCVYMNYSDERTSGTLMTAHAQGAHCHGVWVARYFTHNPYAVREWVSGTVGPKSEIPCATVGWQYFGDYKTYLDGDQINPDAAIAQFVLERLVQP